MSRYDANTAAVEVLTFKEGLLSAMAHDLRLAVRRFSLELEGASAKAEFDAGSIEVVTAMKGGHDAPGSLPDVAKGEIEKNLRTDVLDVKHHPQVRFESTAVSEGEVRGKLTLHGVTREVRGARATSGGRDVVEFTLDQRDFGIKPFSAMLGTLKIKPEVRVRVSVPKA